MKIKLTFPPKLENQAMRAYQQFQTIDSALAKNTFLVSLKTQNEVLYFKLLQDHLKEMFSIVYTPTEVRPLIDH